MKRTDKNRPLRFGFTTGACAAAAAKAAAVALLEQQHVQTVQIELPGGKHVEFTLHTCVFDLNRATCSIIKDAGDDPDVTHNAEINAEVSFADIKGIEIDGGEGVGRVTKPGLDTPVGAAAINPVPRRMIMESVQECLAKVARGKGLRVIISVTDGRNIALKTLNSRLGIMGGISILGTSGIVIPYSAAAYTASIAKALSVTAACGYDTAVLTTGRRSEKYAQAELKLPEECYIQSGDYIGFSLRQCVKKKMKKVVIWSMIGKTSKLADGHMYTNVSDNQVNISSMHRVAIQSGVPKEVLETAGEAITANHFRKLVPLEALKIFGAELCRLAAKQCSEYISGKAIIECIMTDPDGVMLGRASV